MAGRWPPSRVPSPAAAAARPRTRRGRGEGHRRAGRDPAAEARRDGRGVFGHRPDRGPRGSRRRRQGRRRGAPDLRRGRRHGAARPGARAARRRPPAADAGPDRGQPAQARARLQAHARTGREGPGAEEHGGEHQVRPRRAARGLRQRAARTQLHGDPRADQGRDLAAQHQGRQHHQAERPDVHGHRPRPAGGLRARAGEGIPQDRAGPERRSGGRRARRRALRRHHLAHQPDGRSADRHLPRARRGARRQSRG